VPFGLAAASPFMEFLGVAPAFRGLGDWRKRRGHFGTLGGGLPLGAPISDRPSLLAGDDGDVICITPNATVIAADSALQTRGGSISGAHGWHSAGNRVSCSRLRSRPQLFEAAKGADPRHDAIARRRQRRACHAIDGKIAVRAVPWESDG
jgi:hypothetical protein